VSEHEQEREEREEREREAVEESRIERGLRYGHRTGLYAALVVAIGVLVFLILLIAGNTHRVKLDYVVDTVYARLIWLVIISAICGWVLGIVTAFLIRRRTRGPG
jgi:uncharacterized integral membrane protein